MNDDEYRKFLASNENLFFGSADLIKNKGEFASSYLSSMPFIKTTRLIVDASNVGNETRFINHSSNKNYINCEVITVTMRYYDLLTISGYRMEDSKLIDKLKDLLISVPVYITTKKVNKDQQFLGNYGDQYFETLNITPVELKP